MRVPSYADAGPEQLKEANHALIAIAEGGSRAFVLTADSKRWCLRVAPSGRQRDRRAAAPVYSSSGACGRSGAGVISDHEVLLLLTEGDKEPTYRLLRVRGL